MRSISARPLRTWPYARAVVSLLFSTLCLAAVLPAEVFALSYSPTSMTFSATQGTSPSAQTLTFWKSGGREKSWTASSPVTWMTVSPGSGSLSTEKDQVQVALNTSNLAPGSYSSSVMIRIVNLNGSIRTTAVPISVTVTAAAPVISLAPTALSFSGTAGGSNPAGQAITVSNTGGGTLSWTASDNAAWLALAPVSGTNNGTMTATVSTAGLAAGTYSGAVTVSASGATAKTIPITLTLAAQTAAPVIAFSRTNISFSGTAGGPNPAAQSFTISNAGSGTLSWSLTDSAAWLSLSPASGTNGTAVTVSVDLSGLAAGTYNATITATATGATTKTLPVTLTVGAASAPVISLSPATLSFSATAGGSNPASQTVGVTNTGTGTLSWTATDNAAWLSISPASGTNAGSIMASVNISGLAAGTYSGTITVSATGATAKTVPVTLVVSASSTPAIGLSPTSLSFSATAGGANPTAKTLSISNTGGGTLTWTATDNAAWLSVSPASGTNAGTITVSINTSGLAAGTFNGTITLSATGATTKTVPVTLTLSAPNTGSATLSWNANTDGDLAGYKVYRATASGGYGAPIATLGKTVTSYVASSLQTGTTYFFVITAYDSAGNESSFSNEVSKSIF